MSCHQSEHANARGDFDMNDLNIIDTFTQTFVTYIDSGFGLLTPDVSFLTSTLVAIDVILAGLFWSMSHEDNVIGQLIRKILYVGFFAPGRIT